jgi:hypothetical protein
MNNQISFKAIFERSLDILHSLVYFLFQIHCQGKKFSVLYMYHISIMSIREKKMHGGKESEREKKPLNRTLPGAGEKNVI